MKKTNNTSLKFHILNHWLFKRKELIETHAPASFLFMSTTVLNSFVKSYPVSGFNVQNINPEVFNYLDDIFIIACDNVKKKQLILSLSLVIPFIAAFFEYTTYTNAFISSILSSLVFHYIFNINIKEILAELLTNLDEFNGSLMKNESNKQINET